MTSPSQAKENQERRETLENDRKVREEASTMFDHARSSADDDRGGRFAGVNPTMVVGSTPGPIYPRLPSSSPWHGPDPVPIEPSLGYSVDALEPAMGSSFSPVAAQAGPGPDALSLTEGSDQQHRSGPFSPEELSK
jgi:hypothetical protein